MDYVAEPRTRGRICKWYDAHGNVVEMTLDSWSADNELETTVVVHLGPFDDISEHEATLVRLLTAQQALF